MPMSRATRRILPGCGPGRRCGRVRRAGRRREQRRGTIRAATLAGPADVVAVPRRARPCRRCSPSPPCCRSSPSPRWRLRRAGRLDAYTDGDHPHRAAGAARAGHRRHGEPGRRSAAARAGAHARRSARSSRRRGVRDRGRARRATGGRCARSPPRRRRAATRVWRSWDSAAASATSCGGSPAATRASPSSRRSGGRAAAAHPRAQAHARRAAARRRQPPVRPLRLHPARAGVDLHGGQPAAAGPLRRTAGAPGRPDARRVAAPRRSCGSCSSPTRTATSTRSTPSACGARRCATTTANGRITPNDGVDPNRNFPNHWGYDEEGSSSLPDERGLPRAGARLGAGDARARRGCSTGSASRSWSTGTPPAAGCCTATAGRPRRRPPTTRSPTRSPATSTGPAIRGFHPASAPTCST